MDNPNTYIETNPVLIQPKATPKPKLKFDWKKIKRVIFPSLTFSIIAISTFVGVRLVQENQELREKAAGNGVSLTMNSSATSLNVNQTATVDLIIDTGEDTISATELHISYNPQVLEAQSITNEDFLPVVLVPGSAGGGNASITLGSQPTEPKKGVGRLASITFKALAGGTSEISYADSSQVAALGQSTNAIDNKSGTQIAVNGPTSPPTSSPAAFPTSVPTSDPSPTSSPTVTPGGKTGDVNSDGVVNIIDIGIILDHFDSSPPSDARADLNSDNTVNIVDIGIVIDNLD